MLTSTKKFVAGGPGGPGDPGGPGGPLLPSGPPGPGGPFIPTEPHSPCRTTQLIASLSVLTQIHNVILHLC